MGRNGSGNVISEVIGVRPATGRAGPQVACAVCSVYP